MLRKLHVERFKGFEDYEIDFQRVNLLVGGNNSGKTTVFHALQALYWCLEQTADLDSNSVTFRKTQVPELGWVPYFETRDLFFRQRTRTGRLPTRIRLSLTTTVLAKPLSFEIYPAFSRNIMVDGEGNGTISRAEFDQLRQIRPVYIPGTIGITVREELYRTVAQERMISEGRQNQVLRNLVLRLQRSPDEWREFIGIVNPLFKLHGIEVPFSEDRDEWLSAIYNEGDCAFDFVSAGSGFLQVVNLLSFLFLHSARVALLDEPDSHMHEDLQRLTFDLLDGLSKKKDIQLIIATHSSTLIDAAGLENVLLIDRAEKKPLRARDADELVPLLAERGMSLPPAKVMDTLRSRKVLFVEGREADYQDFVLRFGEVVEPNFKSLTRGLTVFETGGATHEWPFSAIEAFQRLLGANIAYIYVSDRDFFTDSEIADREVRAAAERHRIVHLERRNRECYLVQPGAVARLVENKWRAKHPGEEVPDLATEAKIHALVLDDAKAREEIVRAALLVAHESSLKGDASHRSREMILLNEYFRTNYSEPLHRGEIPYRLLDGKEALAAVRREVAAKLSISFSDKEILGSFRRDEIPLDVRTLVESILGMFPAPAPAAPAQLTLTQ